MGSEYWLRELGLAIKGTIGVTQRYGKTNYSYVYKYSGGFIQA